MQFFRVYRVGFVFALAAALGGVVAPARAQQFGGVAKPPQDVYTLNAGSGSGSPAFARYSTPDLALLEVTPSGNVRRTWRLERAASRTSPTPPRTGTDRVCRL